MAGGATVGSGRAYRLDPHTLPARSAPVTGDVAAAAFIIEGDHAIVRRAGAALTVPIDAYRGVAVRMEAIGDNGDVRAFVELLHNDPDLTLPLAMNDDPYAVAGDWQAWGRTLNLPLLIVGQDGSVGEPLAVTTGVHMGRPKPRRTIGRVDAVAVVFGREIIARN